MRTLRPKLIFAMVTILYAQSSTSGDVSVDSWLLSSAVHDFAPGHDPQEFVSFYSVQNPFQTSHMVTLGQSHVSTSYDFGSTGDFAHFDAYTNHNIEQLYGSTLSEGRIYITPAVDTLVTLEGAWQFSWPSATIGASNMAMRVYDVNTDQILVGTGAAGGNTGLGPPYGDYHFQNSGLLLAGEPYMIYYVARIVHDNPTPTGTHGEGSGEIHFSLTPVPEPAPLALFALALLIPRREHVF